MTWRGWTKWEWGWEWEWEWERTVPPAPEPVLDQLVVEGVAVNPKGPGRRQAAALIDVQGDRQVLLLEVSLGQIETNTVLDHLDDDHFHPVFQWHDSAPRVPGEPFPLQLDLCQ